MASLECVPLGDICRHCLQFQISITGQSVVVMAYPQATDINQRGINLMVDTESVTAQGVACGVSHAGYDLGSNEVGRDRGFTLYTQNPSSAPLCDDI